MDLKTKLAFALVSASLLSMAVLGYFTHRATVELFLADSRGQLNALAESRKNEIDAVLHGWYDIVQQTVERLESSPLTHRDIAAKDAHTLQVLARILDETKAENNILRRVTLFDKEGAALLTAGTALREGAAPLYVDEPILADLVEEADGSQSVLLHAVLHRHGEPIGRVELAFDARPLDRFIGADRSIGVTGQTALLIPVRSNVGTDRSFLVSSLRSRRPGGSRDTLFIEAPRPIAESLRSEGRTLDNVFDHEGREISAAARPLAVPGWGVVVEVASDEAWLRAGRLIANMRDLGIALAAFATLGGVLLGLHMGRPINQLKEQVDRIRHGELGLRLNVKGEDEVAFLAQSLNEFIDQLDRSSDLFRLGQLRVLVVEPNAPSRRLLGDLLENWGMRPTLVETGANALGALDQAAKAGQPIQLVLLDESIADMQVISLVERLRALPSGTVPVVALASKIEGADAERMKTCGVDRLLPKPVVASHLMEAILDEMGIDAEGLVPTGDTYLNKTTPRTILLVEDNRLMQQVMIGFLENWGHDVRLANNGRAALEANEGEHFDLILMDVVMPEMDGLEATAAIRSRERGGVERTPIVALTAEALTGDRERCLAAGMDDYITKPVDPKALYALIERFPARAAATSLRPGAASQSEPSSIVDWDRARSLTNDDDMLLDELIAAFPAESTEQLSGMRRAIEERDPQSLTRSAHSLKSTANIFGASALAEISQEIENLGHTEELEEVTSLLGGLETELRHVLAALESQTGRGAPSL
jgi:CheY-like chemotaxis protein